MTGNHARPPKVYVASPLGFTEAGRNYLADVLVPLATARFVVLDPWDVPEDPFGSLPPELEGEQLRHAMHAVDMEIGARNAELLVECDGVLAVLDGADVDSGTAAEVGFAAGMERPVVGVRTDSRDSGDNAGVEVNLQVEYFIRASGGAVVADVTEAVELLARLLDERPPRPRPRPPKQWGAAGDP